MERVVRRTRVFRRVAGRRLSIELFMPAGRPPRVGRPAIMWWSGGGWRHGGLGVYRRQCAYLASRGVVAGSAEYRVVRQGKSYSAAWAAEDAKSAVRWLRVNARRLGIDPGRIAAAGESSGATMAVQTAVSEGFEARGERLEVPSRPDALVLFDPPMHFRVLWRFFVGRMRMPPGEARRLIPNLNLRRGIPPTFVCWSRRDWLAPGLEEFVRIARRLRLPVTARVVAAQPHGFMKVTPWNEICAGWTEDFLVSLGWLRGRPSIRPPRMPFDLSRPVFGRSLWPLPETSRWDAAVAACGGAAGRGCQLSFAQLRGGGIAIVAALGPGDRVRSRDPRAFADVLALAFASAAPSFDPSTRGLAQGRTLSGARGAPVEGFDPRKLAVCVVGFPHRTLLVRRGRDFR